MADDDGKSQTSKVQEKEDISAPPDVLTDATPEETRRVLWKIDLIILPLLASCYMFQFLDKMALNYATLLGLLEDTKLVGSQYSWTSSIFYFGYFVASYLSAYLCVRLPIGKYLSATVVIWAATLMCHAACQNFDHLMAVRFFLGAMEAGVAPGFSLLTGIWYRREEQPLRHGLWFGGNCVANIIGAVASWGIGQIDGSLSPWRYMFLIFGAGTAVCGIAMLVFLPDHPTTAFWLNQRERRVAMHRVMDNMTGVKSNKFKMYQVKEALKDPKTWLMTLYIFSVNLANGGLTSFGSLVIEGFGYEGIQALLIQMPSGGAQVGFVLISSLICTYVPNSRIITMLCLTGISVAGISMMFALGDDQKEGKMAGYCLVMSFVANMPLGLSLIASNTGGFTKKSVVTALTFIAYCVGNLIGPQFFRPEEEPEYPQGIRGCLSGLCLGAFFLCCMRLYLGWENRRRDRKYGVVVLSEISDEQKALDSDDKTDWEVTTFRYVV
ncbi:hypothetical protein FQN54_003849 [Arachnomyces sp. PD_36]|nr:hypothetical protein FQN54_003849 [Arachnomyces sp. PD_36]